MYNMITVFFICTLFNQLVTGLIVSYAEVQKLGLNCNHKDSCKEPRTEDSPGISWPYSCSCNRLCSQFDTCCADSHYNSEKPSTVRPSCQNVEMNHTKTAYYMVDRCSSNNSESIWEKLCNEELTVSDDLLKLTPVTSLFTSMTYKNYFCFRCHENTKDYSYWRVLLVGKSSHHLQPKSDRTFQYNDDKKSLTVTFGEKNVSIPVLLKFDIPNDISSLPVECLPDVISDCSHDWHDLSVRDKCHAYTGIVVFRKRRTVVKYKNAHCALCNFEYLEAMVGCERDSNREDNLGDNDLLLNPADDSRDPEREEKKLFSFTYLLDINQSDGDLVGKVQKCKENFLWDPYRNKCIRLVCPLPGRVLKHGKCVRE